jgi:hypothetical protein
MSARLQTLASALVILFLAAVAISAELPLPPKEPVMPNLPQLARRSGYIFSGTVKSIERIKPVSANAVPVVRIIFHVDKGYLGVRSGQDLPVREYAGLWQSGQTYRRGERILLFLYPPSKLGLTSAVGGMSGRFAVEPGGGIIVDPGRASVRPLHAPEPVRRLPSRVQLSPEEFKRALRSALEAKP